MTREILIKRLHEMAVETGGLNCLGCGFEHSCGIHGCAVLKQVAEMIERTPQVGRCGTCLYALSCYSYTVGGFLDDDYCSRYVPQDIDKEARADG